MHGERGEMTLVGLLVAMALFLGVIAATLSLFATSETTNRDTQRRTDAMDRARVGIDLLTRQMRGMASPTPDQPQAIDRATARDVVFQTVDPVGPNSGSNAVNVKRVRYCLDDSGQLWMQNQRWTSATPPAAPSDGGTCPSGTWNDQSVLADDLTNYQASRSRPVFSFTPASPASTSAITAVHVDLWIDLDIANKPVETAISSGVFLRNQNRAPTALFTATPSAQGIVLNASTASDPEGEPLSYCWYDPGVATVNSPPAPCSAGNLLGSGVTIVDPVASNATRTVTLVVRDPALLSATYTLTVKNGT